MKTATISTETAKAYEMAVTIYRSRGTVAQMLYMLEKQFPNLRVVFSVGLFPISDGPVISAEARDAILRAACAIHGNVNGVGINADGDLVVLI